MAVIPLTRIQNWLYPFRFIGRVWIFLALEANTDMLRVGAMLVLNIQFVSNTLEITTVNLNSRLISVHLHQDSSFGTIQTGADL